MLYVNGTLRLGALFLVLSSVVACQKKSLLDLPSPSSSAAAETSAYPAVVKVILPGGRGLCSGTFISPRAVLTAAHCTLATGTYTVSGSFGTFTTAHRVNYGPGVVDDPNDISILYFDHDVADPAAGQVAKIGAGAQSGDIVRLIGYGCNSVATKRGSGVKRTGTNMVYDVNEYLELLTPKSVPSFVGIIGSDNRAGACFGDSGGPAVEAGVEGNDVLTIKGVAHSGGETSEAYVSDYVDMGRSDNRGFIAQVNRDYALGVEGF